MLERYKEGGKQMRELGNEALTVLSFAASFGVMVLAIMIQLKLEKRAYQKLKEEKTNGAKR